jgi:hypothetical protein
MRGFGEILLDLNTFRSHGHAWGRMILSVFVVSWLSVSLQPCLMAMESDDAMAMQTGHSAHAVHDEHAMSPGAETDCGHCPPAACEVEMSCDVEMSSECQTDVQCSLDSRRVKFLLKDAQYDPLPGIVAIAATPPFSEHRILPSPTRVAAYAPGYQLPLNLLNCVYLI